MVKIRVRGVRNQILFHNQGFNLTFNSIAWTIDWLEGHLESTKLKTSLSPMFSGLGIKINSLGISQALIRKSIFLVLVKNQLYYANVGTPIKSKSLMIKYCS